MHAVVILESPCYLALRKKFGTAIQAFSATLIGTKTIPEQKLFMPQKHIKVMGIIFEPEKL